MVDWRPFLTKGERGVIMVAAADKSQAGVIFSYIKSFIADVKALRPLIVRETLDTLELSNGISVEVAAASYKSIRGRTVVAFLADELAFWPIEGHDTDAEVLAAIRPAMATIANAKLLVASSPYARRGEFGVPTTNTTASPVRRWSGRRHQDDEPGGAGPCHRRGI